MRDERYIDDRVARLCALAVLVCAALALALVALLPARALAADAYQVTKLDITAEAQTDASLHVIEVRTFTLDSATSSISWLAFDPMPDNATLVVNSMRVGFLNDDGALIDDALEAVELVEFDESYRTGNARTQMGCTYDEEENKVYLFCPSQADRPASMVVEFDYTVVNGVQLFKDCAEIDWKYVNEAWPVGSDNVELHFALPVPSGVEAVQGENVYVWGHGPASGEISDLQDGSITFSVDHVNADAYAETRIICPLSWFAHVSDPDAYENADNMHLDWALEQEQDWTDASRVRAKQADVANSIGAVACIVLLLAGLIVCLVAGRTRKSRVIAGSVLTWEVLGLHPALFGRLARWNRHDDADLIATVQRLAQAGALRVSWIAGAASADGRADLLLERVAADEANGAAAETAPAALAALDEAALELIFERIGQGASQVKASDIVAFAQANPDEYVAAMGAWTSSLDARVKRARLFDAGTARWARVLRWVAGLMALFALCAYLIGHDNTMAAMFIVSAVVMSLFAYYTKRMTQGGSDLYAEQAALQTALKEGDASLLAQGGSDEWAALLNRAYLLGVAEPAASALRAARPELFADADAGSWRASEVPWQAWFAAQEGTDCAADVLESAVDDAYAAAQETKRTRDVEVRAFRKLRARRKKAQS